MGAAAVVYCTAPHKHLPVIIAALAIQASKMSLGDASVIIAWGLMVTRA